MKTVSIGMIGGGFAARLHGNSFKQVGGLAIRLRGVADLNLDAAEHLAKEYGYEVATNDYRDLLKDPEIDVVIICTPPFLHENMIMEAMQAGKYVICEKPLTGYFGLSEDEGLIGDTVSKRKMYESVMNGLNRLERVIGESDKRFMYAENYIYTPTIQRAVEFLKAKKSTITFMKGEESVQGSPTAGAGYWRNIGGGTLLRIGCHPLAGILYLKSVEAQAKGKEISVESVVADTGRISPRLTDEERKYLRVNPKDVEDFGTMTITFSDGTKATIFANDNVVGGIKNYVEIYCNDATMLCNITPTNDLQTYFLDQAGLDDVYMSENLDHKTGWNNVFVSESVQRGYVAQLQDFMECVAYDREPLSNFKLAKEIMQVLYAAYISAEEDKKIYLNGLIG